MNLFEGTPTNRVVLRVPRATWRATVDLVGERAFKKVYMVIPGHSTWPGRYKPQSRSGIWPVSCTVTVLENPAGSDLGSFLMIFLMICSMISSTKILILFMKILILLEKS